MESLQLQAPQSPEDQLDFEISKLRQGINSEQVSGESDMKYDSKGKENDALRLANHLGIPTSLSLLGMPWVNHRLMTT